MTNSFAAFKVGTRESRLALIQTRQAVALLQECLPKFSFTIVPFSSPGDRDQHTDLRSSPGDFFTRDLDSAVLDGDLACAIHSAKDMPDPMPDGLDYCWLPNPADRRDALILRPGETVADLPSRCRIGVSSDRREKYARKRFPDAALCKIRGNIEVRLQKLDHADVDMLLMAGCALIRLGLENRITEWIPLEELWTPEGQGSLGLTFPQGAPEFVKLRGLFTKAVTFAGAGAGTRDQVTAAVQDALATCDVCLHDALMDARLLHLLPASAKIIDVGKRAGEHRVPQQETTALITTFARQGKRVVRLKGGDPGIFGRLTEETEALDALKMPYRVLPGISSLQTATTATGMLLTRRGVSNGFTVMTARQKGGGLAPLDAGSRARLPIAFFMGVTVIPDIAAALIADGWPADTPAAVVFDAGGPREQIVQGDLTTLPALSQARNSDAPGLVLVGDAAASTFPQWGLLAGKRVMLTCSDALQKRAVQSVVDYGGNALSFPLIELQLVANAAAVVRDVDVFDWLILTSPSAVRLFGALMKAGRVDARTIPKLLAGGQRTADACRELGLVADAVPEKSAGTEAVLDAARSAIPAGSRVLRLRSDQAGPALAEHLRGLGVEVADRVLYGNTDVKYQELPAFDAIIFASSSAVAAYLRQFDREILDDACIVAIGKPTAAALREAGIHLDVVPDQMTIEDAVAALARHALQHGEETRF